MAEESPQPRSDADRRARQADRLGRVLRVLRCILGPGRWDAESLAEELECSTRTVHRILQTLTMAGVPWFYCQDSRCYRVREGFRFPGIAREAKQAEPPPCDDGIDTDAVLPAARQLLEDGERFMESLRRFCETLGSSDT
jgi:hypothetical protein